MKTICIVGPGAIGGMMAVLLQRAGFEVSALARPARAAEIADRGLVLFDSGHRLTGRPRVAAAAAELGPHDLVVVTVKGGGLGWAVDQLPALSGPDTPWLFVMNGVPWWFLSGFGGALAGRPLASVDPDGRLARAVPLARLVWGVINCNVMIRPDGAFEHVHSNQLQLGRPDGAQRGLNAVADVFRAAGYNAETTARIRDAIWGKLLVNMTFNPLSVLSMATTDALFAEPLVCELAARVTDEGRAVGAALGLPVGPPGAERFAARPAAAIRAKTSMLADLERGRPLETGPLIGAVVELAELAGVSVPFTRALYGLLRLRAQTLAGG